MTQFETAMCAGSPAAGWSYLWNANGTIGSPSNYSPLVATSNTSAYYDTDGSATLPTNGGGYLNFGVVPTVASLLNQGRAGGHPGTGTNVGTEHYAIATYTVSTPGTYAILNGTLTNCDASVDGLSVKVHVNGNTIAFSGITAVGQGSQIQFAPALGTLSAGDIVYVAVGSHVDDGADTFSLAYSIALVSEPTCISIIGFGAATLLLRWRRLAKVR